MKPVSTIERGRGRACLNPSFYSQFCPLILSEQTASAVWQPGQGTTGDAGGRTGAEGRCGLSDCPDGIDLTGTCNRTSRISGTRVRQIVYNTETSRSGRRYEDLWKFTLLNYTSNGLSGQRHPRTINNGNVLNWDNVAYNLQPACRTGIDHVDRFQRRRKRYGIDYLVNLTPVAPTPGLPNVVYPTPRPGETWPYP